MESTETFESSFLSWKAKEVLPHGAIGVKAKSLGNRILVIGKKPFKQFQWQIARRQYNRDHKFVIFSVRNITNL